MCEDRIKTHKVISKSPEETRTLAGDLARELKSCGALDRPGAVLALHGELGSGKTCFVQGLAQALGIRQAVTSPTFTMVNEYQGECPLIHVDLYRIHTAEELLSIDLEDYFDSGGITVIEWAERAGAWLPANTRHIYFESGADPDVRTIILVAGPPA
ncbi:MAG: tRNA (adenosine(37)-N6)-threonylcarbamoyltransferase complex ATPase subunit type 1 TsaE [Lentisphaerae bacterium]|nr:tRNA (adenosine(37)-N6)-threonylcarbamoyltransferase complex ATPase subunit type 1 TsaE [Lentisphaerota bacterium]